MLERLNSLKQISANNDREISSVRFDSLKVNASEKFTQKIQELSNEKKKDNVTLKHNKVNSHTEEVNILDFSEKLSSMKKNNNQAVNNDNSTTSQVIKSDNKGNKSEFSITPPEKWQVNWGWGFVNASSQDKNGNKYDFSLDSRGLITSKTDKDGKKNESSITPPEKWQVNWGWGFVNASSQDKNGNKYDFSLDSRGLITSKTDKDGKKNESSITPPEKWQVNWGWGFINASSQDKNGNKYDFSLDKGGLITSKTERA